MNSDQQQITETYLTNKDLIAIFNEASVGPKRLQILKWIKDLIDKPKHAHKEEEKLKGLDVEASVMQDISKGNTESQEILNEFNQAKVKEGNIYVRSLTLKRWKEKKVRLDEIQKQFTIVSKKKPKTLNLTTYAIKWVGQKKEYQAFTLDSLSNQNKYKQMMFGWINFDGSRLWHDAILQLVNQLQVNTIPREAQSLQVNNNKSLVQQSTLMPSVSQESQQNQLPVKRKASLQLNIQEEKQEEQNKPDVQIKENKKEEIVDKKSPISQSSSDNKSNEVKQEEQKVKVESEKPIQESKQSEKQNEQEDQLEQNQEIFYTTSAPNFTESEKQAKLSPKNENDSSKRQEIQEKEEVKQNNEPKIILNKAEPQKNEEQISQQKQEEKQEERQEDQCDQQGSEVVQEVEYNLEHLDEYKRPQTIAEFLDNEYKLESIKDEKDYKTVSFNNGMRLLQSLEDPRKFKIFLAFQGVSSFEIFNCISNVDDYQKWNNNVAETKVLNLMKNEQTAIIYQKHKGIGIMYRPRDFVYLRHAFIKDQNYYIVDKSIEYDSLPSSISIVRGEIEHVVWFFHSHPQDEGRSLMITDFYYNNSGYSNKEQDASITFAYLNHFSNLFGFITQKSFQKSITINMFDLPELNQQKKGIARSNEKQEKGNKQNLSATKESPQKNIGSSSPTSSKQQQEQVNAQKQQQLMENIAKIEETQNTTSANNLSKTSFEQLEDEEKINVRLAYEQEELQNMQLNQELSKFNVEALSTEPVTEPDEQVQVRQSVSKVMNQVNEKKPGDKLSGMTIPDIIEFVNNNKHWGVCVDQKYSMGRIDCEEKRIHSDPERGHYQFKKDWERCLKTGKFLFLNKEKIATQKKVISFLLSKIGSNILSGKSITSISLPIDIFEPRSNLERFAYSCAFAPIYLKRAADLSDPLEQMKNCAMFLVTTTIMYLDLEKPFNPILGETYQGRLDGYPFYCEQISHHPPICAFQYYADTYNINATLESIAQMHANSVTGINQGNVIIKFNKTDNEVGIMQAPGSLNGTAFGTRYMSVDGKYLAYDIKNKLVLEIKVNPEKKGFFKSAGNTMDYMAGGIYKVNDKFIQKFQSLKPHFYKFQGLNIKDDVVEQLCTITGYWNQEIFIDDVKWFDIEDPLPFLLENEINPIASDCNYRQDILYLKDGNKKDGQEYKELLENSQRADRKVREKQHEIRKKQQKNKKK